MGMDGEKKETNAAWKVADIKRLDHTSRAIERYASREA